MVAAVSISETSVSFYETARQYPRRQSPCSRESLKCRLKLRSDDLPSKILQKGLNNSVFHSWFPIGTGQTVSRVAQSVQCLATGWTTGRSRFDPRQKRKDFSCSVCVQTGSGAHPASCPMGTGAIFPGAKARLGRKADHSPPSSAEFENEWELYHLSPQAPSWRVVGQFSFNRSNYSFKAQQ
jgi:hypothetical protein